jgi:acyl-CoA synthetase (AMP-forming)/AMP-acid ligase II
LHHGEEVGNPVSGPAPESLAEILAWRSRHHPDRMAYAFLGDDGSEVARLTYGELDRWARGLACVLQESVSEGERVLLLLPPGLDFVAGFFACLYAGSVAVPAYPPRLGRSQVRLRSVARDARPAAVLTSPAILAKAAGLIREVPELGSVRWLTTVDDLSAATDLWRAPRPDPGKVAFLQYTSGSTAEPKGVMVSHGNLLHNEEAMRQAFDQSEESVIVGWLPLYHDMGLIGNVLQTLYAGARCLLMSPLTFLKRPWRWLEAISRYGGTTSGGPNFAYDLCVRQADPARLAELDLSRWTVAFNGAEPVRAETQERFAATFAPCGFRSEAFYPCYGLAEGTLFVSGGSPVTAAVVETVQTAALERNRVVAAAEEGEVRRLVGCGHAWAGQRIAVVDPESRLPVPPDTVGEVWVSGASVALGYWRRPEETERVFQGFLADSGDGPFLRSGDLGFVRGGELFVTGRIKDLLIFRGRNLYPQDVEQTVERSHPALRPGCGAAFSVDSGGEERLVVVQEVERRAAAAAAEAVEQIAAAVRGAVSEEHEVPLFDLVLLQAGTIPKTSSGKVRRHACRAAYLAGEMAVVARPAAAGEAARLLPRTPAEQALAALWSELLGVATVAVGDHFFELGGDSVLSARLVARLRETCGVEVPVAAIFERPTLAALAAWIDGRRGQVTEPPLRRREPGTGGLPLSFFQERLWFLDQMDPGTPAYNIPVVLALRGGLDAPALERSLVAVGSRHEVLRTAFASTAGRPVQVVAPLTDLHLPPPPGKGRRGGSPRARRPSASASRSRRPGAPCCSGWTTGSTCCSSPSTTSRSMAGRSGCCSASSKRSTAAFPADAGRPCRSCRSSTPTMRSGSGAGSPERCWKSTSPTGGSGWAASRRSCRCRSTARGRPSGRSAERPSAAA